MLPWQSGVRAAGPSVWASNPKIFSGWPFAKRANLLYMCGATLTLSQTSTHLPRDCPLGQLRLHRRDGELRLESVARQGDWFPDKSIIKLTALKFLLISSFFSPNLLLIIFFNQNSSEKSFSLPLPLGILSGKLSQTNFLAFFCSKPQSTDHLLQRTSQFLWIFEHKYSNSLLGQDLCCFKSCAH